MFLAEGLLGDFDRAREERLRLLIPPLRVVESGQVAEALGGVGMFRAEDLLADFECAYERRLRLLISPL